MSFLSHQSPPMKTAAEAREAMSFASPPDTVVIVGREPDITKFHFHKGALAAVSSFFGVALNGTYKESTTGEILLPEAKASAVDNFARWLYHGRRLDGKSPFASVDDFDSRLETAVDVFVLGDMVGCVEFRDLGIDYIEDSRSEHQDHRPSDALIRRIYAFNFPSPPETARVRGAVVTLTAQYLKGGNWGTISPESRDERDKVMALPAHFVTDLIDEWLANYDNLWFLKGETKECACKLNPKQGEAKDGVYGIRSRFRTWKKEARSLYLNVGIGPVPSYGSGCQHTCSIGGTDDGWG